VIPNYSGGAVATGEIIEMEDECKDDLKKPAKRLDHLIASLPGREYRPSVKYQLGESSLAYTIFEFTTANPIDMTVMGAPSDSTFEHLLMGNGPLMVLMLLAASAVVLTSVAPLLCHKVALTTMILQIANSENIITKLLSICIFLFEVNSPGAYP
jgi:hypothetical protein